MNREAREHEDRNLEILKAFAHCFHKVLPFCCSQASFRHLKSNELMDVRVDPEIVSSAKHVLVLIEGKGKTNGKSSHIFSAIRQARVLV